MKINRNNYEAFFMDYLEGNLDVKMVDDFIEFLKQNPDLKDELSLYETVSIEKEEITFNNKHLLLKEIYDAENEFDRAAIARMEGDISVSENTEFENYLTSHPERQKEIELFEKTKLQPDESVVFGRKNKLYRRSAGRTVLLWTTRVAAVAIVVLSVYIFIDKYSTQIIPENQIVSVEKTTDKKEINPSVKETSAKNEIKQDQVLIKEKATKPAVKRVETKSEPNKSLEGMLENADLALVRIPTEVPTELQGLSASISATTPKTDLVPVTLAIQETAEADYDEKFLVDVIKEKTGIGKLTFNKITKAGLSLVSNLSKEKFKYGTNTEGKITELNYESRIFAFYIPTKNEMAGK